MDISAIVGISQPRVLPKTCALSIIPNFERTSTEEVFFMYLHELLLVWEVGWVWFHSRQSILMQVHIA
jgi:hypothetical protein